MNLNPPETGIFAAYVQPEVKLVVNDEGDTILDVHDYHVHLVNDTDTAFANVATRSGEYVTTDESVHQGKVITRPPEPLAARTARKLDQAEYWVLDFTTWWHIDLYRDAATDTPQRFWFTIYGVGTLNLRVEHLPVLNVVGRRIALRPRDALGSPAVT